MNVRSQAITGVLLAQWMIAPLAVAAEGAPASKQAAPRSDPLPKPAAEPQSQRSRELAEAGELSRRVVELFNAKRYAEALPLAQRCLAIREKRLGSQHSLVAQALINVAAQHRGMRQYTEAEPLYKRALAIRQKILPEDHPDTAKSLRELALLYIIMGKYAQAEPFLRRALQNSEKGFGPESSETADCLNNLVLTYYRMQEYTKALPLAQRCLAIREKRLGCQHPLVAQALTNVAAQHRGMRQYPEAEALYRRALAIREKVLPEDHPDAIESLRELAALSHARGRYVEAVPFCRRVVQINEKRFGSESLEVAHSLNQLADTYLRMRMYAKALPLDKRCLAILEKRLGRQHRLVALGLYNMAAQYRGMGQYAEAEAFYRRALQMSEEVCDPESLPVGNCLVGLAKLHMDTGRYAKSEALYRRALRIFEKVSAPGSFELADCFAGLAALHYSTGQYTKAVQLLKQAQRITEKSLPHDHPDVAALLSALVALYHGMGRYAEAESLCREGSEITRKALGEAHPNYALALHNLATLYSGMGRYAEAEPLHRQALQITKKALGEAHPSYASYLNSLGSLCQSMGRYAESERLTRRAVEIYKKALGKEHPDYARALASLGHLYGSTGRDAEAELLHRQVLEITKKALGEAHPDVAANLANLADLYRFMERYAEAEPLFRQALEIRKRALGEEHPDYSSTLHNWAHLQYASRHLEEAWETEGRRLKVYARARRIGAHRPLDQVSWQEKHGGCALYPILALRLGKDVDVLRLLEDQRALVLRELLEKGGAAEGARPRGDPSVSFADLGSSGLLNEARALVGWLDLGTDHYGYVARRGGIQWIKLDSIRLDVDGLRRSILDRGREDWSDGLRQLYRERLAPLKEALRGAKRLIVMNQGWAAMLPMELMQRAEDQSTGTSTSTRWLDGQYEIHYCPSATVAVRLAEATDPAKPMASAGVLAFGDPPFSKEQLAEMARPGHEQVALGVDRSSNTSSVKQVSDAFHWSPHARPNRLPFTLREVVQIGRLIRPSRLLVGPQASEGQLWELNRSGELAKYRYVHFATHGFANEDRPELSGLLLSLVDRDVRDGHRDGILQMREIMELKLKADLVVLSACQTGRGKLTRGEGMVGLSHAFFHAGARSLLVSLWSVNDVSTSLLMERFYENLIQRKLRKSAALREAKQWLRGLTRKQVTKLIESGNEAARRNRDFGAPVVSTEGISDEDTKEHPYAHPYYWAPFVLIGDGD